jgi:hypothetical protein
MPAEKPPKKEVSERRRIQNKQAQKKYRKQKCSTAICCTTNSLCPGERQKGNLQILQDIAISSHSFLVGHANRGGRYMESERGIGTDASPNRVGILDASIAHSQSPAFLETENIGPPSGGTEDSPSHSLLTDQQPHSLSIPKFSATPESTHEYGLLGYLLQHEGINLDEEIKNQVFDRKMTLETILKAGLKALSLESSLDSNSDQNGGERVTNGATLRTDRILVLHDDNTKYGTSLPDIHRNHIQMKPLLYVAACIANASALGIFFSAETCEDVESPFFRDSISESAAKAACLNDYTSLKTHLRPCAAQLMQRHHPWIDVFPFPTLRERAIKLAYCEEPMIDEDDFCNDLTEGLVCWGSVNGDGSSAMGSGAPWDVRSWEAQPWFLKKWWIVIGDAEGEIYKQTQWWRQMRGERFCDQRSLFTST